KADGTTRRNEKELVSEAEAESAGARMAAELFARGFVERTAAGSKASPPPSRKAPAAPRPAARAQPEKVAADYALEGARDEVGREEDAPVLFRAGRGNAPIRSASPAEADEGETRARSG